MKGKSSDLKGVKLILLMYCFILRTFLSVKANSTGFYQEKQSKAGVQGQFSLLFDRFMITENPKE